jgi:hypothetical protein
MRTLLCVLLCQIALGQASKPAQMEKGDKVTVIQSMRDCRISDKGELKCSLLDIDVPAIQRHCIHKEGSTRYCRVSPDAQGHEVYADRHPDGWICKDFDRILLTSEDGKKHCIKFPKE